jgi:hypothetical protein
MMSNKNFLSSLMFDQSITLVFTVNYLLTLLILSVSQKSNYFLEMINFGIISVLIDSESDRSIYSEINSIINLQYKVRVESRTTSSQ